MNYTEEPVVSQGANATFRANERAFAVSPQACILAYATLESRISTRSTAAAIALESCTDLRPSVDAQPGSRPGMLGSVSSYVLREAQVPVLVVKAPENEE